MEEHPNVDSLRAFASDALEKDERRSVLAHLIQCEGCRGKLALIMPEEGPPPPAALPSQRTESKKTEPVSRKRFKKWSRG